MSDDAALSSAPPAGTRARSTALVVVAVTVVALAHAAATHPRMAGSLASYGVLAGPYVLGAFLAVWTFWQDGTLRDRLQPRWGDVSLGFLMMAVLLLGSFAVRSALAPAGSEQQEWLWRLYVQLGPMVGFERPGLSAALCGIALAEELTWRGLVLTHLERLLGTRRGWLVAWLLYAAALVPTAFTLAGDVAGPNPLLPLAALGAGLPWTYYVARTGRMPPVLLSHVAFTWFSVVQFRVPG